MGDLYRGMTYLRNDLQDLDQYTEAATVQGKVRFNLALAYKYRRQYREAATYYMEALDWFTLRGFAAEKGMAHQNLAWLFCTLNQLDDARSHLELADGYRDTLSPKFDAEQICCWAFYYWKIGQVGSAMNLIQEILLAGRPGVDAHHRGQAALIGGQIALLMGRPIRPSRCWISPGAQPSTPTTGRLLRTAPSFRMRLHADRIRSDQGANHLSLHTRAFTCQRQGGASNEACDGCFACGVEPVGHDYHSVGRESTDPDQHGR